MHAPSLPSDISPVESTGTSFLPRQSRPTTAVVTVTLYGQDLWPPLTATTHLTTTSALAADFSLEPNQSLPKTPEEALLADASETLSPGPEGSQCQSAVFEVQTKNPLVDEWALPIVIHLPHHTLTSYKHTFAHLPLLCTCHSTLQHHSIILQAPC
jgi:hypothetical protein